MVLNFDLLMNNIYNIYSSPIESRKEKKLGNKKSHIIILRPNTLMISRLKRESERKTEDYRA